MIDFPRYLAAKKSVDDRALNRDVWQRLRAALAVREHQHPLRVLELGCGIGTMVERLLEWELAEQVSYLGIDAQVENIRGAQKRLAAWGTANGYHCQDDTQQLTLRKGKQSWQVRFQQADVLTFQSQKGKYDLLIAQAFLDLVDIPIVLPLLRHWLAPDGLFYFTINFDGETIFEPVSNKAREAKIIGAYHQSMDDRQINGKPSGDSRTGRHLFKHLKDAGAQILAAGASDWVVYPGPDGYPADEAYFLHCILDFFAQSLEGHPQLAPAELADWLSEHRTKIEHGELIYIAHQLDFLAKIDS